MGVTLAQLEAFVWVARLGKVREAAVQLNVSQPTISLRLRDLEQAIGASVFERIGRGLRLTAEGVGMLDHANVVLREVGKIRTYGEAREVRGVIRLGVSETFAVCGLPSLLEIVADEHRSLRLELSVGPSPDMIDDLHERRLDLAVVINPIDDARLRVAPLGVQQSTWAAMPGLELPRTVRPPDVRHLTVLVNPSPSPNYRQTMAWYAAAGMEPLHLSVCNTVPSAVAHLVEAGVGIAILPTKLIEPHLKAGTLVTLACRPAIDKAYLCVVHRANDAQPALQAVLAAVRRSLAESDLLASI